MQLSIQHWAYLHGAPTSLGELKSQAEDFVVKEQLSFQPCGEGEHLFLFVEKQNLNTGFVAQELAKHFKVKERDVAYAGRKDKFATTQQWFSVYLPGQEPDLSTLNIDNTRLLAATRHTKKLRLGTIAHNSFEITLRNCQLQTDFEARLDAICTSGVPNYFGSQRFGNLHADGRYGNLALAEELIKGNEIRKRDKRSMAISALRSWLFNEFVSERINQDAFNQPLSGDAFLLSGNNSFFSEAEMSPELQQRFAEQDILLSAPLWGKGPLPSQAAALLFEQSVSDRHPKVCHALAALGLKQERRAIRLMPQQLHYEIEKNDLKLQFSLPSGCFATSVIRELFANLS